MRAQTLEQRIEVLEARVAQLEGDGWLKLSVAASKLGISTDTLRRRIHHAIAHPTESPFLKGVHWRDTGNQYQIHLNNWEKAMLTA